MGSRFNVFFADKYDAGINDNMTGRKKMIKVLGLAVQDCISKNNKNSGGEFQGYSGDIASGENKLIFSEEEFTISKKHEKLLEKGNDDWNFPYDDDWFDQIRLLVESRCEKWGGSLCVKINGRFAIMGFYSD